MLWRSMLLFVFLSSPPLLPAQTTLAWKFRTGDTFSVEQQVVQTTALETKNKPFQQKSEWKLLSRWQVKETGKDSAKLLVTVDALTSKTYAGDTKVGLPSKEDELWRGAEFSFTTDPQGRLRDLKGHEALLKKLAGDSPQRLKILTALKPPDFFQALFQDVLGPMPENPVRPGDRWQSSAADSMSIFGTLVHTTEFTCRAPSDGLQSVESSTKTVFKAPRYAIENDVFRITKGEVRADDGKGSLLFDAAKGRMQRVHKSINVRGDLTLETLTGMQRIEFTSGTEVRIEIK